MSQAVCILYLAISGHIIADCARIKQAKMSKMQPQADASDAKQADNLVDGKKSDNLVSQDSSLDAGGFPWCNRFSSMSRKEYHFDVEFDDKKCVQGACVAIKLVRDAQEPTLEVYGSKQWLVTRNPKTKELSWDRYSPGVERNDNVVIKLKEVTSIRFVQGDDTHPDELDIELPFADDHSTTTSKKDIFSVVGGLFYDEDIMEKGIDKFTNEDFSKTQKNASEPTNYVTGKNKGKWIGGAGGALTVGGFYTAATITGVAVQTQALVGAAVCGIIGGAVVGAVTGGVIGLGISLALVMGGYSSVKGYEISSAGRKIFEKIRCMTDSFHMCSENLYVPIIEGESTKDVKRRCFKAGR